MHDSQFLACTALITLHLLTLVSCKEIMCAATYQTIRHTMLLFLNIEVANVLNTFWTVRGTCRWLLCETVSIGCLWYFYERLPSIE